MLVIVLFTTSGQRYGWRPDVARAQNQPRVSTKPMRFRRAAAAIASSARRSAGRAVVVQVRIVAPPASRQLVGLNPWCGASPMTTTRAENRADEAISEVTPRIGGRGLCVPAQLPMIIVTCGRAAAARAFAQRSH